MSDTADLSKEGSVKLVISPGAEVMCDPEAKGKSVILIMILFTVWVFLFAMDFLH